MCLGGDGGRREGVFDAEGEVGHEELEGGDLGVELGGGEGLVFEAFEAGDLGEEEDLVAGGRGGEQRVGVGVGQGGDAFEGLLDVLLH